MWIDETAMHRGWTIRPLKSLFSFSKGLNITKEDLCEEGTAVVSYGQIHSKNYHGTGIEEPIVRFVHRPKLQTTSDLESKSGASYSLTLLKTLRELATAPTTTLRMSCMADTIPLSSIQSSVSITSTLPIFSRPMHGVRSFGAI